MDSGVQCKLPKEEKNVDEKFVNVKALKNVINEKLLLPKCASVGPVNPESNRKVKKNLAEKETHPTVSPLTPLDGVFDSFAPSGRELLLNAPRCIKFRGESQINVVRRLNFEADSKSEEEEEEEMLLKIVYENLLEAIIASGLPLDDGCKTPPDSAKRISGVAETCPEAPIKCSRKSRNFDKTLCTRRLDF